MTADDRNGRARSHPRAVTDCRPIIFDLDDTLIESFPTYVELHQRIATELGWRVPSRVELTVYGVTWEETLARLWPEGDLARFIARYDVLADAHPYPAFPGVTDALVELECRGHSLWIVTKRSRRRLLQRMVEAEIAPALFDGIFCVEDQPAPKPDPRCFAPVWRALAVGAPASNALFVGDRDEDRRAAEAAGIEFVAVRTGPEVELGFPGGLAQDRVLASVADLPHWLDGENSTG